MPFIAEKRSCGSYLLLLQAASSICALFPPLNWIYNLQPLPQNPRCGSVAATMKNKKKEKLTAFWCFLVPRHNGTLCVLNFLFVFQQMPNWNNVNYLHLAGKDTCWSPTSRRAGEEGLRFPPQQKPVYILAINWNRQAERSLTSCSPHRYRHAG